MEKDIALSLIVLFMLTFGLGYFYGDKVINRLDKDTESQEKVPDHDHALFYVIVDGEEMTFLEPEYQLARNEVHLENNRSDIVHKHFKGVKWSTFLDSINVTYNQTGDELCIDAKNVSRCDKGTVLLNNESANLSKEINQGDNFVIALGRNHTAKAREYSAKEVPGPWRDPGRYGRKI